MINKVNKINFKINQINFKILNKKRIIKLWSIIDYSLQLEWIRYLITGLKNHSSKKMFKHQKLIKKKMEMKYNPETNSN